MPFVVTSCFLSPQGTQSERIRSQYISPVRFAYWLFRLFSRHISRMQSFQENRPFIFQARVVLKPLLLLTCRFVACISVDTHTDKPTTVTLAARRVNNLTLTHVYHTDLLYPATLTNTITHNIIPHRSHKKYIHIYPATDLHTNT